MYVYEINNAKPKRATSVELRRHIVPFGHMAVLMLTEHSDY
jgi:hypothetical protein